MTLTVDAAGAAFNSSIATVSVKPASRRFWPPFCDWEPALCINIYNAFASIYKKPPICINGKYLV